MAKKPLAHTEIPIIIGHLRNMVSSPDPLSILVRGMILIDLALADLVDAFSTQPFNKIEDAFDHPSLYQKAVLACSMGALGQGELACIKEINLLRNRLAHRIDINIVQKDEEKVVNVFRGQTKLFSGLMYDPNGFPKTFVFLLLVLFYVLHLRGNKVGTRITHVPDENVESVAAVIMTTSMIKVMRENAEADDPRIMEVLNQEVDEAKRYRDENDTA